MYKIKKKKPQFASENQLAIFFGGGVESAIASVSIPLDNFISNGTIDLPETVELPTIPSREILSTVDLVVCNDAFNKRNYQFTPKDLSPASKLKDRFADNVAAIRLLKDLEKSPRELSLKDKETLNHYTGWGALPQAFDYYGDEWKSEYFLLKSLFTEQEYDSAKASTPNAHYTDPEIIQFMYDALRRMGFDGGRILEPSSGVGYFLGLMPEEMSAKSRITAVELDSISGSIAKMLYPDADVRIQGFEEARMLDGFFDLAISNVPFGNYKVYDANDTDLNKHKFSIHNYFFAKAMKKVRPGGIVTFITSSYTMDAIDTEFREYMASKADLIASFRLPECAFLKVANTKVVTDIIFLKKKEQEDVSADPPVWVHTAPVFVHTSPVKRKSSPHLNKYYHKNPDAVFGKISVEVSRYGDNELTVKKSGDVDILLKNALSSMPHDVYKPAVVKTERRNPSVIEAPEGMKDGLHIVKDGEIYRSENSTLTHIPFSNDNKARMSAVVGIRDAARQLLARQLERGDAQLAEGMATLNALYDAFVAKYGYLNASQNRAIYKTDADYPLILSLENWDEDSQTASKSDIFFNRVIYTHKKAERAENVQEAMLITLSETGGMLDFQRMSDLMGLPESAIIASLSQAGLIFKLPDSGQWVTSDEYLSGFVKDKLKDAEIAAESDPAFAANVTALSAVIPHDIPAEEISVRLGSSWIPTYVIKEFIEYVIGESGVVVEFSPISATWFVSTYRYSRYSIESSVKNTTEFGTEMLSALEIIEKTLNHQNIVVKDCIGEDKNGKKIYVVNVAKTEAAREKQYLIISKFEEWIWKDPVRCLNLVRIYNDTMNTIRNRQYDGSNIILHNVNPQIELRPHQKDAVWRILQSQTTLLAHVVGSGKTYICAAAAMECKRLGIAHKPMLVVPNHLLEQWAAEILRLYPAANVLIAGKEDFTPQNRKLLFSKIAMSNWDAVIVGHSSFEKVAVSNDTLNALINKEIADLEYRIREENDRGGRQTRVIKDMEKRKKNLRAKLFMKANEENKDNLLNFEELGVDMLLVDESDMFKNLGFATKMRGVAGLPNTESNRAFDMFVKVNHMVGLGNKVVFATGTPISNTMGEMFTLQRFLGMGALLHHFDAWAGTFGEIISSFEISPDGSGYRVINRFARFVNLPELMNMFRMFADIQTADMLDIPMPKLKGDSPDTVVAPPTIELKEYTQQLVKRAEAIRSGRVDPRTDNMLCVTNDGRKAALDMRIMDTVYCDTPDSKVNNAVANIIAIYKQTIISKGTQLVFCDLSTPQNTNFSVYTDIKNKLVMSGIPVHEIAFIHNADTDAKKKVLFDKVNVGKVRILMGSTTKMGTGMNVQRRLVALHHIDAPWRPRDIEQREGRILRQGNTNDIVEIYRYVTEESFDSYIWQTLENKARFIAQIMNGSNIARTAEDVEGAALTYAEVKALASGNPLVMEKFKVDNEIRRLNMLKTQHKRSLISMQSDLSLLSLKVDTYKSHIERHEADLKVRTVQEKFSIVIDNIVYDNREKAGDAILSKTSSLRGMIVPEKIGSYSGFDLYIASDKKSFMNSFGQIIAKGSAEHIGNITASALGTIASLDYAVRNIESKVAGYKAMLDSALKNIESLTAEIEKPFAYDDNLKTLTARKKEIDSALDLDKHQSIGSGDVAEGEVKLAA